MPVVEINGEKKKVACGPCIRGHRSSKCQHSDRVLIEVRKPGRPLSACPHPSGSCGCQRAVFYTVPKNEASPSPSVPLSPAASIFSPPIPLSSANRIQKSRLRKNSTSVTPSTVQRAFDGDPVILAQHANGYEEPGTLPETAEPSSSVPSLVSSSSSTPQTEAVDSGSHSNGVQPVPLRLGMMGVGGFGASPDDMGWSGAWPDYNEIPIAQTPIETPKQSSCCGHTITPPLEPVVQTSSCCAGKKAKQPAEIDTTVAQHMPGQTESGSGVHEIAHSSAGVSAPFVLPMMRPPALGTIQSTFSEDQFGCLHQPNHACECGEGCQCLGCSTHPANRATTDYVRYHTELAMRGYFDTLGMYMPPLPVVQSHLPQFFGSAMVPPSAYVQSGVQSGQMIPPQFNGVYHAHSPWMSTPQPLATPTLEMSQFSLQPSSTFTPTTQDFVARTTEPAVQGLCCSHKESPKVRSRPASRHSMNAFEHDSPSTEDDTSTLSPSAFSLQQFSLPGCSDITGSCLCGDGCQCEGCLVHSGHANATKEVSSEEAGDALATPTTMHASSFHASSASNYAQDSFDDLLLRDSAYSPLVPG